MVTVTGSQELNTSTVDARVWELGLHCLSQHAEEMLWHAHARVICHNVDALPRQASNLSTADGHVAERAAKTVPIQPKAVSAPLGPANMKVEGFEGIELDADAVAMPSSPVSSSRVTLFAFLKNCLALPGVPPPRFAMSRASAGQWPLKAGLICCVKAI